MTDATDEAAREAIALGPLTYRERQRFDQYEGTIGEKLAGFVAVGTALLRIRDERMYREKYPTFDAYLLERWTLSRFYASRLIGAAEVVERVAKLATVPPPTNEAQARALGGAPEDRQAEIWEEASRQAREAGERSASAARVERVAARARAGLPTRDDAEREGRRLREGGERARREEAVAGVRRALKTLLRRATALRAGEREEIERLAEPLRDYAAGLE